jgi:hypothetical protein
MNENEGTLDLEQMSPLISSASSPNHVPAQIYQERHNFSSSIPLQVEFTGSKSSRHIRPLRLKTAFPADFPIFSENSINYK